MVRSLAGQPAVFQPITLRRTLREGEFTESQLSDHLHLSYVSSKPLSINFFKKTGCHYVAPASLELVVQIKPASTHRLFGSWVP